MGLVEATKTCLRNYVTFSGRARRSEYWWFLLFFMVVSFVLSVVDGALFGTVGASRHGPLVGLFQLAMFLPLLGAGWRRLHDSGRPGWYLVIPVALSVATAVLLLAGVLVLAMTDSAAPGNGDATGAVAREYALIGLPVTAAIVLAQILVCGLLVWWLTRPTEPQPNQFGPVPLS